MNLSLKSNAKKLALLCAAVYFFSYISRINYAAVMVEMISKEGFTKSGASVALTGLFITYGIGQIISGYLGDRLRPHLLIFSGLLVSAAMNLLIPVSGHIGIMTAVWCVNGLAQAFMWPPLVKIMSSLLTEEEYKKSTVTVSWGSSFGTIFVYLTAPLFINVGSWKLVFFFSALATAVMAFVWLFSYNNLEKSMVAINPKPIENTITEKASSGLQKNIYPMLFIIMLAIVMQGILRDGITTWMPSYVSEIFKMENTVSILTSIGLPIFSIFTYQMVSLLNRKLIKNEIFCAALVFTLGFISLLLLKVGSANLIFAIIMLTLAVGCMHGVNLILICMIPTYFKRTGKTSLVSGLLNSCTYVGSSISTYGVAVLSENSGWDATVLVWCLVALLGTVFCAILISTWAKYKKIVEA